MGTAWWGGCGNFMKMSSIVSGKLQQPLLLLLLLWSVSICIKDNASTSRITIQNNKGNIQQPGDGSAVPSEVKVLRGISPGKF